MAAEHSALSLSDLQLLDAKTLALALSMIQQHKDYPSLAKVIAAEKSARSDASAGLAALEKIRLKTEAKWAAAQEDHFKAERKRIMALTPEERQNERDAAEEADPCPGVGQYGNVGAAIEYSEWSDRQELRDRLYA